MKRYKYISLWFYAAALLCAACTPEEKFMVDKGGISFEVKFDSDTVITRTKVSDLVSEEGTALPLFCEVIDNAPVSDAGAHPTKGYQFNTGHGEMSLSLFYEKLSTFKLSGWNADESSFIPSGTDVDYDTSSMRWLTSSKYTWPVGVSKTFYAYGNLPSSGAAVTNPDATVQNLDYSVVPATAAAQKDILLGYYSGVGSSATDYNTDTNTEGVAEIVFYHPLTAVVFKQGDLGDIIKLKSITIEGVYKSGKTTQDGSTGRNFVWTDLSTDMQDVTIDLTSTTLPGRNKQIGEAFLLIPQNLADNNVRITVVAVTPDGDKTFSTTLDTDEWKAGKTNVYTLGYDSFYFGLADASEVNTKPTSTYTLVDPSLAEVMLTYDATDTLVIPISSYRLCDDGTKEYQEWDVYSTQNGDGREIMFSDFSYYAFSDAAGAIAGRKSKLDIKLNHIPSTKYATHRGYHAYWMGGHGDWCPSSWESYSGALDLSTYDLKKLSSRAIVSRNTANMYIIRHAGKYMLPLVYGNAIKNGNTNEPAYHPETMATGGDATPGRFLDTFLDHAGNPITSPFIEESTGLTITKCAVIWQDEANTVQNLTITEPQDITVDGATKSVKFLQFDVPQATICQSNALIAVYDDKNSNNTVDEDEVIWSWHIWITNDPAIAAADIPVTNYAGNTSTFFSMPCIGWVEGANYPAKEDLKITLIQHETGRRLTIIVHQPEYSEPSNGTFYQFGRKDPMPRVENENLVSGQYIHPEGDAAAGVPYYKSICNPQTFYGKYPDPNHGNFKDKWADEEYLNLWSGMVCVLGYPEKSADMIKTIYDPSPAGYKVPPMSAFSAFATVGSTDGTGEATNKKLWNWDGQPFEMNNGYYFYTSLAPGKKVNTGAETIFFPAARYRRSGPGTISGTGGQYAVNTFDTFTSGNSWFWMSPTELRICAGGGAISTGLSLRPVKE